MAEPALEIRGLSKRFGALRAVDNVSLTLQRGEIHALIGPNGAGKSTLVAQVAGQMRPDAGTILLGGRDVSHLSVAQRARLGLGRTFQVSSLALEFSALRNVMLAVQGTSGHSFRFWSPVASHRPMREAALASLDEVGLADRAGRVAGNVSHGEQRQLEVAMALAMKPRMLLLDEPMAGMGAEETAMMVEILERLRGDKTILLVEHDMDAVFSLADRLSVLVDGHIIATDTVENIRGNTAVQKAYLGDSHA